MARALGPRDRAVFSTVRELREKVKCGEIADTMPASAPAKNTPPSPEPRKRPTAATPYADGKVFFDSHQAAKKLGVSLEVLSAQTRRGNLTPGALNEREGLLYTARDLERYKKKKPDRQRVIVDALQLGLQPIDAYYHAQQLDASVTLKLVIDTVQTYAEVKGWWIVEGPPGSYARWLERMGLVRLMPKHLRRVVEAMLLDPYVAEKARLVLDEMRARGELATTSPPASFSETAPER